MIAVVTQTTISLKHETSAPTRYAAVRLVARGLRRQQYSRPNNGAGLVCSIKYKDDARFCRFTTSYDLDF